MATPEQWANEFQPYQARNNQISPISAGIVLAIEEDFDPINFQQKFQLCHSLDDNVLYVSSWLKARPHVRSESYSSPISIFTFNKLSKEFEKIETINPPDGGKHLLTMFNGSTLLMARFDRMLTRAIYTLNLATKVWAHIGDYPVVASLVEHIPTVVDRKKERLLILAPQVENDFQVENNFQLYSFGLKESMTSTKTVWTMEMLADAHPFVRLEAPQRFDHVALWEDKLYVFGSCIEKAYKPFYPEGMLVTIIDLLTLNYFLVIMPPFSHAGTAFTYTHFSEKRFHQHQAKFFLTTKEGINDVRVYCIDLPTLTFHLKAQFKPSHGIRSQCITNDGEMIFGLVSKHWGLPEKWNGMDRLELHSTWARLPSLQTLARRTLMQQLSFDINVNCTSTRAPVHLRDLSRKRLEEHLANSPALPVLPVIMDEI